MNDIRPIVARKGKDRSPLYFGVGLALVAVFLFLYLNGRREAAQQAPATSEVALPRTTVETVPELVLPLGPAPDPVAARSPQGLNAQPQVIPQPLPVRTVTVPTTRTVPSYPPSRPITPLYAPQPYPIAEVSAPASALPVSPSDNRLNGTGKSQRITASQLDNPSQTVPQGTLISAVLETALDSTGAGQARAMVTRNIYGFDGSQLLVPRGSKLYGTYEAGVDQGQKRALIRWTRLLRPDGVTIALDSAASDPLGRAGVKGSVNNHFGQRLGNALLSSTMGLGNMLMSRRVPQVVVATSGTQAATQITPQTGTIKSTLQVKAGTRVSVFVEHDLDFSTVGSGS